MTKLEELAAIIESARAEYMLEWAGRTDMTLDEFLAMAAEGYFKQFMADIQSKMDQVEEKIAAHRTYKGQVRLREGVFVTIPTAQITLEGRRLLQDLDPTASHNTNLKKVFNFIGALKKHGKTTSK